MDKRRLSFATGNLDDPVQLEILYDQCKEKVLNGTHPVSRETAIKLAAIQMFVIYGPYKSGVENMIKTQNLLPKEYSRAKEHEKNILHEYREILCESATAMKKRYCELCKSLPTYGVTFFQVKERQSPNERKLISRLFGVSKDCVMCVDQKTKIVLKSWPLEQLKRWAASPTTFNIDFGDYTAGYYSMQTLEGETIKKLIAEYIDIILKKSQIADSKGIEGDEGGIMLEDHVPAKRALPFFVENNQVIWRETTQDFGFVKEPLNLNSCKSPQNSDDYNLRNNAKTSVPSYYIDQSLVEPKLSANEFVPIHHKAFDDEYNINKPNHSGNYNLNEKQTIIKNQNNFLVPDNQISSKCDRFLSPQIHNKDNQKQSFITNKQSYNQQNMKVEESSQKNYNNIYQNNFIKINNDLPSTKYFDSSETKFYKPIPFIQQNQNFQNLQNFPRQDVNKNFMTENKIDEQQNARLNNTNFIEKPITDYFTTTSHFPKNNFEKSNENTTINKISFPINQHLNYIEPDQNLNVNQKNYTDNYNLNKNNKTVCSEDSNYLTQQQLSTIDSAIQSNIQTANEAQYYLTAKSISEICNLPELILNGTDVEVQLNWLVTIGTHAVSQHLGTFVVAIAQIIESTSAYSTQSVNVITRHIAFSGVILADLVACVRELCALLWVVSESVASKLLCKMQKLSLTYSFFMEKLKFQNSTKRTEVLSAVSLIGEAACALLCTTSSDNNDKTNNDVQIFYYILNKRIQNIASSTANVVLQAKSLPLPSEKTLQIFQSATKIAFTAGELIALSRVLVSILNTHSTSQQRIAEAVQRVSNAINDLVVEADTRFSSLQRINKTIDSQKKYDQLLTTANFANNSLHQFLTEVQQYSQKKKPVD